YAPEWLQRDAAFAIVRPSLVRSPPRRALVSRPRNRKRFSVKFLRLFPAGAKPDANSVSKHPPSTPTPVPLNIRSWMKPDDCSSRAVNKLVSAIAFHASPITFHPPRSNASTL